MYASVPFPLLRPLKVIGHSKGKGTEAYIGQVGAHFKALIISKSAASSVFTYTQVVIARKLLQCTPYYILKVVLFSFSLGHVLTLKLQPRPLI